MAIMTSGFVEGSLPEELMQILVKLAQMWEDVADPNDIQVKHMTGAMTNEVFQIKWPSEKADNHRKVLVRIYGKGVDVFFDRDEEIRTFECLSKHGHGPRLLGRFPEGRVEEFIHARTLSAADLRDPEISDGIAAKMWEFHNLEMPGSKEAVLWNRMRNWVKKAKNLCSSKDEKEFGLTRLEDEIQMLKKELSKDGTVVGFCHNDLQYGNIMIDEEKGSITLIDYEYASYNPIAYDLANHFCEMAADYHSKTPHILDYSKYPDLEERRRSARAYLSTSGKWQHVKDTYEIGEGKMFSPGNLRATFDNPEYKNLINYYVNEKYTLRYTGGMVPDVNQIIVKEKGIFTNVISPTAKAKLRLLFEVAPLGFMIEKAGGYSSDGTQSVLDKVITNLDDKTQVAYRSKNEIIRFEKTLYGSSRLEGAVPVGAAV